VIVAFSGGIGGAKLALGLSRVLPPDELTVIANIGDDFEHLGLYITPDIDTLLYTLARLDNRELGWGRRDETWSFMDTLAKLGGETWFRLGDRDLALHVERTRRLNSGEPLSAIIADFGRRLGVDARVLPASNDRVPTRVLTDQGWIDFQRWFVGLRAAPAVRALEFVGAAGARALPEALAAIRHAEAVVICPSNPFISIDPILAVPGYREAMRTARATVVAVSPIIAGRAVKGPAAKMMQEFGQSPSARSVAEHYGGLLDAFVADEADFGTLPSLECPVTYAPTLMRTLGDKEALARVVLRATKFGTKTAAAMPSPTYNLFLQAMIDRKQIICVYDGYLRELCPVLLGHSQGQEKALTYQFGGESRSGLPPAGEWRCLWLSKVKKAELRDGLWRTGNAHTTPQDCVESVDYDINPTSPYNPRYRL
jgi:LPPG:FO 2-phospho-L-lactate transferase